MRMKVKQLVISIDRELSFCQAYYFASQNPAEKRGRCSIFKIWRLRLREFARYFQNTQLSQRHENPSSFHSTLPLASIGSYV